MESGISTKAMERPLAFLRAAGVCLTTEFPDA